MVEKVVKKAGSPLWFWIGALILASIIFICSASIVKFAKTYNTIVEWPIRGMLVVITPLLILSIYCLKKGKGEMYSLKADLLPLLIVSLLLGLVGLIPYTLWSMTPLLAFVLIPVYLLHRRALRKMGIAKIPRSKRNRRVIELQCPYDEAFNLCVSALNIVRGKAKILSKDRSMGYIIAKISITRTSWGETITFNIRRIDDKTRIIISSKSMMQIFDFGKNYENIEKITNFLKEHETK